MSGREWMELAVELARSGLGTTAPNPSVGAVVVRDGVLLGSGCTRPVGGDHAELVALKAVAEAGQDPRGATMFVTLEPCCHHGRTPPCTDAILAAGIGRVVVGVVDPFPPMQGTALDVLRAGGVEVELGLCAEACAEVVQGFTRAITHGLPEVCCKAGISLDGNIATASGESQWITGPEARAHAHLLRARSDAILVGIRTALADDPRLTCRTIPGRDPVPVVLDSGLRLPGGAALLGSSRRPVVVCAHDAPQRSLAAEVVRVDRARGGRGVDVEQALRALVERGMHRVLVEGGGEVHRSLLDARLVDTLYLYMGGVMLPGGRPWLGGPPVDALASAVRADGVQVDRLGGEVLLRYRLRHRLED